MTLRFPGVFFDDLRRGLLGPTLTTDEVDGCNAILAAGAGLPVTWVAYMLATAWHETASTMQPVNEYGGPAYFFRRYDLGGANPAIARALGNTQPGDGVKFHGRGYVQLTGRANYERAERELGVDLIKYPDMALQPAIAAAIMRRGMSEGWFTGRRLSHYLPMQPNPHPAAVDYVNARRIINGVDKAQHIAGYARQFEAALINAGWEP